MCARHYACIVAALVLSCHSAAAQVREWVEASGGDWHEPQHWLPADVPDDSNEAASIAARGTYEVTLAQPVTIGGLRVLNPAATLKLTGGGLLIVTEDAFRNDGLIWLSPSQLAPVELRLDRSTRIVGAGTIRLSAVLDGPLTASITGAGPITIAPEQTLVGAGLIEVAVNNQGLISADHPTIPLQIARQVENADTGRLKAAGGILYLTGASISGGRMETAGDGRVRVAGGETFIAGVQSKGVIDILGGGTLAVGEGGLLHEGLIRVFSGEEVGIGILRFEAPVTLGSACVAELHSKGSASRVEVADGATLILEEGTRIHGAGRLFISSGGALENRGEIAADIPDSALGIFVGPLNQSATGALRVVNGAQLELWGATISGGHLLSDESSEIRILGGRFSGLASEGEIVFPGPGSLIFGPDPCTHAGNIVMRGQPTNVYAVDLSGPLSLIGPGRVDLAAPADWLSSHQIVSLNSLGTLTVGAGFAIHGSGLLDVATLHNDGEIIADKPGRAIEVRRNIVQSPGGRIRVMDGAELKLHYGSSISGGMIDANGSGIVRVTGDASLSGLEARGQIEVDSDQTLSVGPEMVVFTDALIRTIGRDVVHFAGPNLLASGTLRLRHGDSFLASITSAPGVPVSMGENFTIGGSGGIDPDSLVNAGLIVADVSGKELRVSAPTIQLGTGRMRAENGGTLVCHFADIRDGTIETDDASTVEFSRELTLTDVALDGTVVVHSDAEVVVHGALANQQRLLLESSSVSGASFLFAPGATLERGGEVILDAPADTPDPEFGAAYGASLTIPSDTSVRGRGIVHGPIVNSGTIVAKEAGERITIRDGVVQASGGLIQAENGRNVILAGGTIAGEGIRAFSGGWVTATGGARLAGVTSSGDFVLGYAFVDGRWEHEGHVTIGSGGDVTFGTLAELRGAADCTLTPSSDPNDFIGSRLEAAPDANLILPPDWSFHGGGVIQGNIVNDTTITADVPGRAIRFEGHIQQTDRGAVFAVNTGIVRVRDGTIEGGAAIADPNSFVRTSGESSLVGLVIDGEVRTSDDTTVRDAAINGAVRTSGDTSMQDVSVSGSLEMYGITRLDNVSIHGPATIFQDGETLIEPGGVHLDGDLTLRAAQTDATLRFDESALIDGASNLELRHFAANARARITVDNNRTGTLGPGIRLTGKGRLEGRIVYHGVLAPGLPVGAIEVTGTLTHTVDSVLAFEFAGAGAGQFDQLTSNGVHEFQNGTFQPVFVDGFQPTGCASWEVVTASAISGTVRLDVSWLPAPPAGTTYRLVVGATRVYFRIARLSDLNADTRTDLADLTVLLAHLGLSGATTADGDLDGDGDVDLADLSVLLQDYGTSCP